MEKLVKPFKILPYIGVVGFIYLLLIKSNNMVYWLITIILLYTSLIYNLRKDKTNLAVNVLLILGGILAITTFFLLSK